MMLTPGSFSEDTDTTSQAFSWGHTLDDYKQWRDEQFFQCAPVQALEAGDEKLTLTFTEKDRSQLIKGVLWPIHE